MKATSTLDVDYGDGDLNRLHPITAWYAPQLKYSYGPKGFGGLPGLILELEQILVIYSAVNITNENNNSDISIPKNKKIITESQMYDAIEAELEIAKQICGEKKISP